jgi:hypothetical protein
MRAGQFFVACIKHDERSLSAMKGKYSHANASKAGEFRPF